MNVRAFYTISFCILCTIGSYNGVKGNPDDDPSNNIDSNACSAPAEACARLRNTEACFELRAKTYQTARVLCGSEILTYGWDVYNARCAELLPEYIMQPTTFEDIQAAVAFAHKYELPISIRGAGHSFNCNSFKAGSLNIDMRTMGNSVSFEKSADGDAYLHVQPGTEFFHVLQFLRENDLADKYHFTHGTCRSVGVIGYHLHGGMGASTAKWANASIAALDVVTADGSFLTLDKYSSSGNKAMLWDAMRVAGSSFGIVTRMTIKLLEGAERKTLLFFVKNSFDNIIDKIPNELDFAWVGLMRWDKTFYSMPNPEMTGSNWVILFELTDPAHVNKAKDWLAANDIETIDVGTEQYPGFPDLPNDSFHSGPAGSWDQHRYPFEDAGAFSRYYSLEEIKDKAKLLNTFFEPRASNCRWNFGPLQGDRENQPIMTVECNTPETIAELKAFVKKNEDILEAKKPGSAYVNLPLDDSREYCAAFWPHYDKLAAIKEIWDPEDFFNIRNGIHPASHTEWKCE